MEKIEASNNFSELCKISEILLISEVNSKDFKSKIEEKVLEGLI